MRYMLRLVGSVVAVTLLVVATHCAAAEPQTPRLAGRITDLAGILSSQESASLDRLLADYERETTHQLAVLTVPTLSGESIEAFSLRVTNAWGLGRKDVDNGILVVVAPVERKVRIELGLGFERYITNAQAGEIIRVQMAPRFRENEFAKGLDQGLRELMRQGRAFVAPPRRATRYSSAIAMARSPADLHVYLQEIPL